MTSIEAYKKFEMKLNKLDSQDNMDIAPGEFVLLFNEQQVNWYISKFSDKSTSTEQDEVQEFIEPDYKLNTGTVKGRYTAFTLPTNYLSYIGSNAECKRGTCIKNLRALKVKISEIETYLRDEYNSPSFDYRETPITLAKNNIQVYTSDFTVKSVNLTYYRYPVNIDIAGYKRLDGVSSITINPELPDESVDKIIDLCVLEVQRSTENGDGFQLSNNRVNNNP